MKKWEYNWVTHDGLHGLTMILDERGQKGWELVSVVITPMTTNYVAFFKRPIASE